MGRFIYFQQFFLYSQRIADSKSIAVHIGIFFSLSGDVILVSSAFTVFIGIGNSLHYNYRIGHLNMLIAVCIALYAAENSLYLGNADISVGIGRKCDKYGIRRPCERL